MYAIDPASNIILTNQSKMIQTSFTRPNDAIPYTTFDVESSIPGALLTFPTGLNIGSAFSVTGIQVLYNLASVPASMGIKWLHLFNVAPTPIDDNLAFDLAQVSSVNWLGAIQIPTPVDYGSTIASQAPTISSSGIASNVLNTGVLAGIDQNIYGILECTTGYTPVALTTLTINLFIKPN